MNATSVKTKRRLTVLFLGGIACLIAALVVRLASGPEDSWECVSGVWVSNGNPASGPPKEGCEAVVGMESDPAEVVETFYRWYLTYPGNPLSDKAYQQRSELSSLFLDSVDVQTTDAAKGGYDPFILAQDKPVSIAVIESAIPGQNATVAIDQTFDGQIKAVDVELVLVDGEWKITAVKESNKTTTERSEAPKRVVYFANAKRSHGQQDCRLVYGVERQVNGEAYEPLLKALFAGPTDEEKAVGYSSFFSPITADSLKTVTVVGKTAYVDLKDIRSLIPNASTSCGGQSLLAQIEETIKHDREVAEVVLAIEGQPQTFYEWLQLACPKASNNCDSGPFN